MKQKEKELWIELYEIAGKIEKLEPWKYLWDIDIMMYASEKYRDVFYCSVMGRGGMHKSIAVYQGKQFDGFMNMLKNNYPDYMLINYQECLTCTYTNRQDTLPKNREIIKELGLNYRGTWTSFECFEKGYEPSPINIEQVEVMIEALSNFYMMFRAIIEEGIKVDFEGGEALARHYDKNKKLYLNYANELLVPNIEYGTVEVNGEFRKAMLQLPQTEMELEYDFLNYLPIRITSNKEADGRKYYPRARFIADKKSGFVISHTLVDKKDYKSEEEYIEKSVEELVKIIFEYGRPKRIYVRDEETKSYLKDLAEKAKIRLSVRPKLTAIDRCYSEFMKMM